MDSSVIDGIKVNNDGSFVVRDSNFDTKNP
jgi:hypothetical protein